MTKKGLPMESLGSVLEQSLKRLDLAGRLNEYAIWPVWNDVVGKVIACNAQPEKIRNGTLIVKVSSPVWMQQLQFLKDMIASKLNQRLKAELVKNIFFTVGRIEIAEEVPTPPPADRDPPRKLNDEIIAAIADPEIRAAFQKLWKSYSGRQARS